MCCCICFVWLHLSCSHGSVHLRNLFHSVWRCWSILSFSDWTAKPGAAITNCTEMCRGTLKKLIGVGVRPLMLWYILWTGHQYYSPGKPLLHGFVPIINVCKQSECLHFPWVLSTMCLKYTIKYIYCNITLGFYRANKCQEFVSDHSGQVHCSGPNAHKSDVRSSYKDLQWFFQD